MCVSQCAVEFQDVPGCVVDRKWTGDWVCIALLFAGPGKDAPDHVRAVGNWRLPPRAAFEMNVLSNRYGLNQFDILTGMVSWSSAEYWFTFLHSLAYREGLGDALAEGGCFSTSSS